MSSNQMSTLSYVISLIGGLLVLVVSIVDLVWFGAGTSNWGGYGGYMRGMMNGYGGFMGSYSGGLYAGITALTLVCGIIIIIGAVMLRMQPQARLVWGTLIIAFSVVSLAGMGGFFVGAILGIIGGAFALSFKQTNT